MLCFYSAGQPNIQLNLALNKPATQRSTWRTAVASHAVDGNNDGAWSASSCIATNIQPSSWWQVDLGAVYGIQSLIIYNRNHWGNYLYRYLGHSRNENGFSSLSHGRKLHLRMLFLCMFKIILIVLYMCPILCNYMQPIMVYNSCNECQLVGVGL